jgi:chemotaxis protein methyltransferase CheR
MMAVISDADLVSFLQEELPRMGLRWRGFRNFRGTVKKRLARRLGELGLASLDAYRDRLASEAGERAVLDAMCRITISRLYRDRGVMEALRTEMRPSRIWSAGCASGEEPYTMALLFPSAEIVATDADAALIERARRGVFQSGSLRELPLELRDAGLRREGDVYVVRDELRARIDFRTQDLRVDMPEGPFDVILCRNVAFTYFDEPGQRTVAQRLCDRLLAGGALVVGQHEEPPDLEGALVRRGRSIYVRSP